MATADPITPPPVRRRGRGPRPWTAAEFTTLTQLPAFAGRTLSLVADTLVEARPGAPAPRPVRFNRAEYYALDAARIFRRQRVQLVRGVILLEPLMSAPHATGVRKATRALEQAFTTNHLVRSQLPLNLEPLSEPHPDVAVVTGSVDDYAADHPTTAVLVVEVADDSVFEDTTSQAELYASAGIPEYWVVDIPNRRLWVFSSPAPVPDGGAAYRGDQTYGPGDTVSPLNAPTAVVPVADLLP